MTSEQKDTLKAALASVAAGIVIVAAAFAVPVGLIGSQEPGPPPRVVESPARTRLYTVQVFRNEVYVAEYGADRRHDLDALLEMIAARYCGGPRLYELTDGMIDYSKPVARPAIAVAIWDSQREEWFHPDGRTRAEPWLLPVKVRTNIGSYGIE